eukprot:TRINITY_DN1683_c0_g1_i1.p2 TRINITY_DN1683_c0_g1~~TRINITY_DN1683_c0_g1_i1.p2  ORF type:complete len:130 (-),score=8.40 TRINITY_DN1683_c0_g1_i1:664-1053(-)
MRISLRVSAAFTKADAVVLPHKSASWLRPSALSSCAATSSSSRSGTESKVPLTLSSPPSSQAKLPPNSTTHCCETLPPQGTTLHHRFLSIHRCIHARFFAFIAPPFPAFTLRSQSTTSSSGRWLQSHPR